MGKNTGTADTSKETLTVLTPNSHEWHEQNYQCYLKIKGLSDFNVCRILCEIGRVDHHILDGKVILTSDNAEFNPLADNWQCFDLIGQYDIERRYEEYDMIGFGYRCHGSANPIVVFEMPDDFGKEELFLTPNRAMCLAILQSRVVVEPGELTFTPKES
jgi:hypothetical protein